MNQVFIYYLILTGIFGLLTLLSVLRVQEKSASTPTKSEKAQGVSTTKGSEGRADDKTAASDK